MGAVDVLVFVSFMLNETIPEVKTSRLLHMTIVTLELGRTKLAQT